MATKVLLVGSGGREAAIAESVTTSPSTILYVISDKLNPSIAKLCGSKGNYRIGAKGATSSPQVVADYAVEKRIDIAVIGPEDPLVSGVADALARNKIPCVGPVKACAMIEGDKSYCRDLMRKHNILYYPEYRSFTSPVEAFSYIEEMNKKGIPLAIKPSGLTGGKGVKLTGEQLTDSDETKEYVESILKDKPGGLQSVVIEEKILYPLEVTIQTFTDGKSVVPAPCVQDYKRAYEDNEGPNTGGMGSYSQSDQLMPFFSRREYEETAQMVLNITSALAKETGERYHGFLYAQMMKGISPAKRRPTTILTEANVRLGDSEAINILPILENDDPIEIYWSMVDETLSAKKLRFANRATVCKYLVPEGYPENPKENQRVEVDQEGMRNTGARYYWASVNMSDEGILTTKSRALAVLGISESLEEAESIAEGATRYVKGALRHRSDIGRNTQEMIKKVQSKWKTYPKLEDRP
ncbi:MAG: phosphoribosylamine--glycine ligase [Promethearchaeati archaeon SRVP18_Atabeyarchaeia-1]